jgi:putative oxidoreductase
MFLMVGFFKLSGDPRMVELFDAIGLGQWFRYVTGSLEVLGAVLLLIPRLSGLGALLLVGVMLGAMATHLFVVGGSPQPAIILLIVTGVVAWGRRKRTMNILAGLR